MRVLIVTDKHDTHIIDATDKDAAILEMVRIFDDNEYYCEIDGNVSGKHPQLLKEARSGNRTSARVLATDRRNKGYEYEDRWRFEDVVVPTGKGWA